MVYTLVVYRGRYIFFRMKLKCFKKYNMMRSEMREVIFKNLISENLRKKEISLSEIFERNGVVAKSERRCFYYIKKVSQMEDENDLKNWIVAQDDASGSHRRHFHIMKEHRDGTGEDKLICKIAGTFYAVMNRNVYTIGFLHSFKVRFTKMPARG